MIYSQQDPRWSKFVYSTGYTIGKTGCLITDITMAYNWFYKQNSTPDQIAKKLKFTNGLLIWSSLANIGMKLVQRSTGCDDNRLAKAFASPVEIGILQVNNSHWVEMTGRKLPVLGYRISDPWNGSSCYTNKYGNRITGFAIVGKA